MSWIKDTFFGGNEKKAAQAQIEQGDRAIDLQRETRDLARGDLAPFRGLGADIVNPLLDFVKGGPETDLERTEGFGAIQKSAAAGGKLNAGGTLRDLVGFNNMLNERNRGNRFNELFNLAVLGSNAASGQATAAQNTGRNISDIMLGQGNAQAAGIIGKGNAARDTISGIASFLGSL
jgi:hypothetical protein